MNTYRFRVRRKPMFGAKTNNRRKYLRVGVFAVSGFIVLTIAALVFLGSLHPVRRFAAFLDQVLPVVNWSGLSISTSPGPGVDYQKLGHSYGIAAGSNMTDLSNSELQARVQDMAGMGVTWVRIDLEWSNVQSDGASSYHWEDYDRVISTLRSHKVNVIAILDYTPEWARASGCDSEKCPPRDSGEFAVFAKQAVTRYSSMGLHVWEVWNEPNNPIFWAPRTDAAAYTALLKKTYTAIHDSDKYAFVLSGGLSPQPTDGTATSRVDFLQRMYDNGAKDYFDAVSDHPYTFPQLPSDNNEGAWAEMSATPTSLRGIMIAHGDSVKKIWITEFGAPTGGPGPTATLAKPNMTGAWHVTDDLQAAIFNKAASLYKTYDWVGPFLWYSYKDAGTSADSNENFFGLIRADGSHKSAYNEFTSVARR